MAYKNNLLEYYGGGSVPYQGYRSGGMALLNRAKSIRKAQKSVLDKGKQVAKKGLFSSIGALAGSMVSKKLFSKALAAALTPVLGPAAVIAAEAITAGGGAYLGAKAGYGKQLNIDTKGWLAGDKEKIDRAQLGEEAFRERGLSAGLLAGAQSFMKSDILDSVKQKMNLKPDVGAMPMGGKMAPDKLGDLSSAYSGSPTGYAEWSSPKDALGVAEKFAYSPTGFGAGEKALGGKSLLGTGDFANQLQSTGEHFASGKFMEGWSPTIREAWQSRINEGIEPVKQLAEDPWQPKTWINKGQEGGIVRDDMALIDMIYRR